MTEDVRQAVADLFAAHRESSFVESSDVADHVNCCLGPVGTGRVSVDVEVAHTHPDVDLQAVADAEPALGELDGDLGAVGREIEAAVDEHAADAVEAVPLALIVDTDQGQRAASFRVNASLADPP